jgi:holliday junction DNA helicase RuvA
MIAYIQGYLDYKSPAYVIIEANSVGYQINISLNTYENIKDLNEARLYTHLQIKEDAHSLYGFVDPKEKEMFLLLISISGVGAATGINILSSISIKDIHRAILHEDIVSLNNVKGIGAKTAKRIILELKDKMVKLDVDDSTELIPSEDNIVKDEALQALITLGFTKGSAEKAIEKIIKQNAGKEIAVEEIIRLALKGS